MKKITSAGLKDIINKTLKHNKAIDIAAINIKKLTDISDYMIICTANSTTHVKTLIEKLCQQLAIGHIKPIGIEGEGNREWMLVDFGNIIVHVMLKSIREYYNLEKLWGLAKIGKTKK